MQGRDHQHPPFRPDLTALRGPLRDGRPPARRRFAGPLGWPVVPHTEGTHRLGPRCALAGIEVALVGSRSEIFDVRAGGAPS